MKEVFDNIRAECARHHITLKELAEKSGIERRTYYKWESKGDMPLSALNKFAEVLDVTTDKLLGLFRLIYRRSPRGTTSQGALPADILQTTPLYPGRVCIY